MNETDPPNPNSKLKKGDRMKAASDNISQSSNNKVMPSYIIISRKDGNSFKNVSPFFINKFFFNTVGDVNNIRKLRDGNLLVETSNTKQSETILAITNFAGQFEVETSPHRSLNYSKGVIRCFDLQFATIEEIKNELKDIVTDVFRIKIKRNGVEKYSHTYILSFTTPKPPEKIRVGFLTVKVDPYIPNPYRCYNCYGYAHPTKQCKKAAVCANCGQARHTENSICDKPPSCINCSGKHNALDRKCCIFKLQKEIKAIQTNKKVSFIEAKNILREQNPNIFLKSYAEAAKCSEKKDIGIQVDFTLAYPPSITLVKPTLKTGTSAARLRSKSLETKDSTLTAFHPALPFIYPASKPSNLPPLLPLTTSSLPSTSPSTTSLPPTSSVSITSSHITSSPICTPRSTTLVTSFTPSEQLHNLAVEGSDSTIPDYSMFTDEDPGKKDADGYKLQNQKRGRPKKNKTADKK